MSGHATRQALSRASSHIEPHLVPPDIVAAADILCHSYDVLDVRFCGLLMQAEADIVAALQPMPTYEVALRDMMAYLVRGVAEVRDGFAFAGDLVSLRLIHGGGDLNAILSPDDIARVAIISPQGGKGYLFDVYPSEVGVVTGHLDGLQGDRLTFIATDASELEKAAIDDAYHHRLSPPRDPETEHYRSVARLLAQALADSVNLGMESQASLLGTLSALRTAAARFIRDVAQYQKGAVKAEQSLPPFETPKTSVPQSAVSHMSLRASALQLEKTIRQQLGNAHTSPALRQNLLMSLQQLQAAKAVHMAPSQIRVMATPRPQAVMPLRGAMPAPVSITQTSSPAARIMIDTAQAHVSLPQPAAPVATQPLATSAAHPRTRMSAGQSQLPAFVGQLFAALPRVLATAVVVVAPVVLASTYRPLAAPDSSFNMSGQSVFAVNYAPATQTIPTVMASFSVARGAAVAGEMAIKVVQLDHLPVTAPVAAGNAEPVLTNALPAAPTPVALAIAKYASPIMAITDRPALQSQQLVSVAPIVDVSSPEISPVQAVVINQTAPQTIYASNIPNLPSFADRQEFPSHRDLDQGRTVIVPDIWRDKIFSTVGRAQTFVSGMANPVTEYGQVLYRQANDAIKSIWQNVTKQCCGCAGLCGGATTVSGQVLNLVKRITGVDAALGFLGVGKTETRSADAARRALSDRINKPQPTIN